MQEKESIVVVRPELKIPSLGNSNPEYRNIKIFNGCEVRIEDSAMRITIRHHSLKKPSLGISVRHHLASHVMPNSYPRDGIFNPCLTTIKDFYIPTLGITVRHHSASLVMPNSSVPS